MSDKVVIRDCTLICGDAREILPTITADTLIIDPVWPNAPDGMFPGVDPYKLFSEIIDATPVSVKRAAFHLGCNSDPTMLGPAALRWKFFRACWLEYVRPGYIGRLLYTSDVAYLFGDPPPVRAGNFVISGLCRLVNSKRGPVDHPCPRQPHHVEWLVGKWTDPADVVCDPTMGSGTTGLGCIRHNRAFVGIESNEQYFQEACRRIEAEYERTALIDQVPTLETKQRDLFSS